MKSAGKKIWPIDKKYYSISAGCNTRLSIEIPVSETGTPQMTQIELWEHDFLSPDDLLGEFKFLIDEKPGRYVCDLRMSKRAKGKYSLRWESWIS